MCGPAPPPSSAHPQHQRCCAIADIEVSPEVCGTVSRPATGTRHDPGRRSGACGHQDLPAEVTMMAGDVITERGSRPGSLRRESAAERRFRAAATWVLLERLVAQIGSYGQGGCTGWQALPVLAGVEPDRAGQREHAGGAERLAVRACDTEDEAVAVADPGDGAAGCRASDSRRAGGVRQTGCAGTWRRPGREPAGLPAGRSSRSVRRSHGCRRCRAGQSGNWPRVHHGKPARKVDHAEPGRCPPAIAHRPAVAARSLADNRPAQAWLPAGRWPRRGAIVRRQVQVLVEADVDPGSRVSAEPR